MVALSIPGRNALVVHMCALTLTSRVFAANEGGTSSSFMPVTIPALLIKQSTCPNRVIADLAAAQTASQSETSTVAARTSAPMDSHSAAVVSTAAKLRSQSTSLHGACLCAKRWATSRPIPEPAPVITTVSPAMLLPRTDESSLTNHNSATPAMSAAAVVVVAVAAASSPPAARMNRPWRSEAPERRNPRFARGSSWGGRHRWLATELQAAPAAAAAHFSKSANAGDHVRTAKCG